MTNTTDTRDWHQAGELVWVNLINASENRHAKGKLRPAVLIGRDGTQWLVMGLTTSRAYQTGSPRVAVPDPAKVGLRGPGYLWGRRLCRIAPVDVGDHIGWVDSALVREIAALAPLRDGEVRELLRAAREHHPDPPEANGLDAADSLKVGGRGRWLA